MRSHQQFPLVPPPGFVLQMAMYKPGAIPSNNVMVVFKTEDIDQLVNWLGQTLLGAKSLQTIINRQLAEERRPPKKRRGEQVTPVEVPNSNTADTEPPIGRMLLPELEGPEPDDEETDNQLSQEVTEENGNEE